MEWWCIDIGGVSNIWMHRQQGVSVSFQCSKEGIAGRYYTSEFLPSWQKSTRLLRQVSDGSEWGKGVS